MSEWGWVLKHAILDLWEAKRALALKVAKALLLATLAIGVGLVGRASWDFIRIVDNGGKHLNTSPPLFYAPVRDCELELSGLPPGFKVDQKEFGLKGPGGGLQVVFACRREGGLQWIERREGRKDFEDWGKRRAGGDGRWIDALRKGQASVEETARLRRLEAMSWEPTEARFSARAWAESMGLAPLSSASRGVASATDASVSIGPLNWMARVIEGLFLTIMLILGLALKLCFFLWPVMVWAFFSFSAGFFCSGYLSQSAQGWRRWAPWAAGAACFALVIPAGLGFSALAMSAYSTLSPNFAVSGALSPSLSLLMRPQDSSVMALIAQAQIGFLSLLMLLVAAGLIVALALRAPAMARSARERFLAKALELAQTPEFKARAERRELRQVAIGDAPSRSKAKGLKGSGSGSAPRL